VAKIPKSLHEPINTAFPTNVALIATVLPNGFAQVTARGSTMVFDDEHIALWERGRGSTNANLQDGSKVTVFFRKPELRASGVLPKGGIARFYGTAKIHKSGPIYDQVWDKLIQPEKNGDPDKKGYAVLIKIDRAEDLSGDALKQD
jgi:hypothetical protein